MLEAGGVIEGEGGGLPSSPIRSESNEVESRPRPRLDREPDEDRLEAALARIEELEQQLALSERGRELEGQLRMAGAVDLETALTMTLSILERSERESDGEPVSVADAVGELRRTKPFLFSAGGPGEAGMSPMVASLAEDAGRVAERARETGDRRLLLRYLRLRRGE